MTVGLIKTTVRLALQKGGPPCQGHNQRRRKPNLDKTPTVNATGNRGQTTAKAVNAKVASVAGEHNKNPRSWKKHGLASSIMISPTTSLWPSVKERCCCAAWSQNQEANLC
jgi:hypothetical protein